MRLSELTYDGPTLVKSSKGSLVIVTPGPASGDGGSSVISVNGALISSPLGSNPTARFHDTDQLAFGEALRKELVRLGIVKSATSDSDASSDLKVEVIFLRTHHNPNFHRYTLHVEAKLIGGKETISHQYRILSSENDSIVEKWTTNGSEGKTKAARLLMERLVPDIERYISSM